MHISHSLFSLITTSLALTNPQPNQDITNQNLPPINMFPATTAKPTIYFAYGSNLWLEQMSLRCPTATYLGVARLNNYTWIINNRGYANVVENTNTTNNSSSASTTPIPANETENVVYGLVYALHKEDEEGLDKNEGVPTAYTKEWLECDFWPALHPSPPLSPHEKMDTSAPPTYTRDMLVYIDRRRVKSDVPREEYVYRMNRGIDDALKLGVCIC